MENQKKKHKNTINEKYVKIFWNTMLETIIILVVSFGQIYLLKKLLSNNILV